MGFDYGIPNAGLVKVTCKPERPALPVDVYRPEQQRPLIIQAFGTKFTSWEYESEYRYLVSLDSCQVDRGLYFLQIPKGLLTLACLGVKSDVDPVYVKRLLAASGFEDVPVTKARPDERLYRIHVDGVA